MATPASEVLEINSRLRHALSEVAERESLIRHQAERLALLNDFARAISSTLDLDSVFTLVVRQVARLLGSERCSVSQLDPETGRLRLRANSKDPATVSTESGAASPDSGPSATVSISIGDTKWGELTVETSELDPDRLDFLDTIASHLALAIRNAELYTQVHDSHQELVIAQRQLIQQERLRALGEMASGVAHDLNNALAPVTGFAELLTNQPDVCADEERLQEYLRLILTGASDAAAVVKRLREFYRPRADGETPAPVDLNAVVQQTIALSQPKWHGLSRADGRRVEVRHELLAISPVDGHEAELREMLMNLVFNAVDACPYGGTITVRTRESPSSPDCVTLEVQDDGIGMSEEVKQRCLEPFFTTKGEHGTGMGMAMVYGTVKRHGGRLEIESAPGKGTIVRILLPKHTPAEARRMTEPLHPIAAPLSPATSVSAQSGLRVLVADDEPLLRAVVGEFLTASGHDVVTTTTGDEAWETFRAGDFDLVITDRAMPGMSGEQLASRIKLRRPTMPVILLTGFGDHMNATNRKPQGVDVVLGKPVTLAALRAGIATARQRSARHA